MHDNEPVLGGVASGNVVILLHGRGGQADDILSFAEENLPPGRFIALQADGNEWYPETFLASRERNEPYLTSALEAIDREVRKAGVPQSKIAIVGFSQGACLALEYAARNPGRLGGIIAFSGGLIGEELSIPEGSLEGTPIFIGCSEDDPFIPLHRVEDSADALKAADAEVILHTYPGSSHAITGKELTHARLILQSI
jgi:predicted esterase